MARENKLPARHGYSWTKEDTVALFKGYKRGLTIEQLAAKHQRTVNAIRIQLEGKEPNTDLIINGTNYTQLLFCARGIIHYKIQLSSKLPNG